MGRPQSIEQHLQEECWRVLGAWLAPGRRWAPVASRKRCRGVVAKGPLSGPLSGLTIKAQALTLCLSRSGSGGRRGSTSWAGEESPDSKGNVLVNGQRG